MSCVVCVCVSVRVCAVYFRFKISCVQKLLPFAYLCTLQTISQFHTYRNVGISGFSVRVNKWAFGKLGKLFKISWITWNDKRLTTKLNESGRIWKRSYHIALPPTPCFAFSPGHRSNGKHHNVWQNVKCNISLPQSTCECQGFGNIRITYAIKFIN